MTDIVEKIVRYFAENIKEILGDTLDAVIVYGSYARDDYSEFSDIDVMILVSLMAEQIKEIEDKISDLAFDYMTKYRVDISPVVINTEHFNEWADNLPYYRNVRNEGIKIRI